VSKDAIAVSIRRYAEGLTQEAKALEKNLIKLLKNAQIAMKSGIADVTFPKGGLKLNGSKPLHTATGSNADTLIINQECLPNIDTSTAIQVRENLVELSIITPPVVEETLGFVEYVTGLLAENGINIVEVVSCYTDTILILEEKDATKAYELLTKIT